MILKTEAQRHLNKLSRLIYLFARECDLGPTWVPTPKDPPLLVSMHPPGVPEPLLILSSLLCSPQGPDVFLGRALAAPRVKLMEDPYQHPELQFFPLRKGPQAAGELIATFELIELDYSGGLEVRGLGSSWDTPWTTPAIPPGPPAAGMWARPRVRRKWQPAPVFLPGKSHGHRNLAGCSP